MAGEYIYMSWHDAPDFELIKGHVTTKEAFEILEREGVETGIDWGKTQQTYGRWVPCNHISDFDMMFCVVKEPARGAFPVTMLWY